MKPREHVERQRSEQRSGAWGLILTGAATVVAILILERRRPLRQRREDQVTHTTRNLAILGVTVITTNLVERAILHPVQTLVSRKRIGLLQRGNMSGAVRMAAGVILLDYMLWWWHWMNHRVPLLWRFHLVHHADRDLDASTALRFHFGEMALSVPFRAAQLLIFGIDSRALDIWQRALIASILFHHSNSRLPRAVDRALTLVMVTPRMHGIHHSDWIDETNSNWSSTVSVWDRLHGTLRLDIPQDRIRIGVPAWQDPDDVRLPRMLTSPFREQRDDWVDGEGVRRVTRTARERHPGADSQLTTWGTASVKGAISASNRSPSSV